jgi:hypothetical protein
VRKLFRFIKNWLEPFCYPTPKELVSALVVGTANLELQKDERVYLNPVAFMFGRIELSGTTLPVFKYCLFDDQVMEFIHMRVEVSLPEQLRFLAFIKDEKTFEPTPVEVKELYKKPFFKLAYHLYQYFPFPMPEKGPHAS